MPKAKKSSNSSSEEKLKQNLDRIKSENEANRSKEYEPPEKGKKS